MTPEKMKEAAPGSGFDVYLDGLRGFAALWVVLGHLRRELLDSGNGWYWLGGLQFVDENLAVPVFIVLSGYLLALPLARGNEWRGWIGFMERRFRRIYPAYLVSLIGSIVLLLAVPYLRELATPRAPEVSDLTRKSVVLHMFMAHLVDYRTQYSINPVMWSLAPEWWTYLFFSVIGAPLLASRKLVTLVLTFTVGMWMFWRFNEINAYIFAAFWIGVCTSYLAFCKKFITVLQKVPSWLIFSIVLLLITWFMFGNFEEKMRLRFFSAGLLGSVLILWGKGIGWFSDVIRRTLESSFARWLGRISYSLYLVHFPLLSMCNSISLNLGLRTLALTSSFAVISGLAVSFALANLLSKNVEYRFVKQRR